MKNSIILIITGLIILSENLFACTAFYYAKEGKVIIGNNEDWKNPFTFIWFVPANEKEYGRVYFGFKEGGFQGAINDQGLWYDGFALKYKPSDSSSVKETYNGNLTEKVLKECSTVDEVINEFKKYNLQFLSSSMFMFGDKYGNSVIIERDSIIKKTGHYQISTNFRQSEVNADSITDRRYINAMKIIIKNDQVSVDVARNILSATHQEGKYPTQYSYICDLTVGKIYLYHFHNFENVVVFNLKEELKKGKHSYEIQSLFPNSYAAERYMDPFVDSMKTRLAKREVVKVSESILKKYIGIYEVDPNIWPGEYFEVTCENGKLFLEASSVLMKSEILPESETQFFFIGIDETYEFKFILDSSKPNPQLIAKMFGMQVLCKKIR
jgi:penicillin V acylase-like amidase (Ntn superfamily)